MLRPRIERGGGVRLRRAFALLATIVLSGCAGSFSDNAIEQRAARRERERRVRAMEAATRSTPPGERLRGAALGEAVSGRAHLFVYERTPDGRAGRYVEKLYFRADGRLVYTNTLWRTDPEGLPGDRWRLDADRLCYVNDSFERGVEHCFALSRRDDGRLQYAYAEPGGEYDRLLTRSTRAIVEGAAAATPASLDAAR
ncbi:MAG: hypothetical protein KDB94_12305 [Acidobacteria bacterium]|nr:hypothetical protein [Acidobacteriota bacterium]